MKFIGIVIALTLAASLELEVDLLSSTAFRGLMADC
jgi:hypothetical protein